MTEFFATNSEKFLSTKYFMKIRPVKVEVLH